MQTIRAHEKTGKDGALSLRIPLGRPEVEYDIVVILQSKEPTGESNERDWPPGYFEQTFGSINDETFVRQPQGEMPPSAAELD